MPFLPLKLDTQSNYWNSRYFFRRSLSGFWFLLDIPSWLWCLLLILLRLPALKKVQGIYCYYGEACVSGLHFPEKKSVKSRSCCFGVRVKLFCVSCQYTSVTIMNWFFVGFCWGYGKFAHSATTQNCHFILTNIQLLRVRRLYSILPSFHFVLLWQNILLESIIEGLEEQLTSFWGQKMKNNISKSDRNCS